jgi:DNA-binding transcriptional regulator YiaG
MRIVARSQIMDHAGTVRGLVRTQLNTVLQVQPGGLTTSGHQVAVLWFMKIQQPMAIISRARRFARSTSTGHDYAALTRAARDGTELSKPDFAMVIGTTSATLTQWELGRQRPPSGTVRLLRAILAAPELCLVLLAHDDSAAA